MNTALHITDIPDELFRFKKHHEPDASTTEKKETVRNLNFAQDSWRRLKKNPAAIASLAVLLIEI